MKTIQALGWYFPDSTGGTEVYVSGLVRALRPLGISSLIAAPRSGHHASDELVGEDRVHRYPVLPEKTFAQHAGREPHGGFDRFVDWLRQQDATLYHQHSLTYGCGLPHLQAAKDAGMKTVLTVHTPGIVCLRDTLLREGVHVCDGRIACDRCASCWLQSRGMPSLLADTLAHMPPALGQRLRGWGRAGTALAATALVEDHLAALQRACLLADRVVVVCQWLHAALSVNGVPAERLLLSRQGVAAETVRQRRRVRPHGAPLVVGFLGRGDPVKGVAVLVEALRFLEADFPLQMQFHVVESNEPHARAYMDRVRREAALDTRITFRPPLAPTQVPAFLAGIDVLAVPSQWLETGPLVVLEALASGVPVIGSDLGGIAELVTHGKTGLLVPHDDAAAWAAALKRLGSDAALLSTLQANIGPVRRMADVADDMQCLYAALAA